MTGRVRAIFAALVLVIALGTVVALVVAVDSEGRDAFGHGNAEQITDAMKARGLIICAAAPPQNVHINGGALTIQELTVDDNPSCTAPLTVQLNTYEDRSHRDAAARAAEGAARPRAFGTVFTWKQYAIYIQGDEATEKAGLRNSVVSALDSVGAN